MKLISKICVFLSLFFICIPQIVFSEMHEGHVNHHDSRDVKGHDHSRGHSPIGVMVADHYHEKGEWMVSYRYMRMEMPNNFSGTKELTVEQVNKDYMVAPVDMTMEMHMLGFMYGVSDDITAALMVPYITKDMEHRRRDGRQFSTRAQGIGDIKLSGLFSLKEYVDHPIHINFGVSLPTGSINRKDATLLGNDQNLPYPMQLGSGTFAVLPGLTYSDHIDNWGWGFQHAATLQLGKNERKYQLGDKHELTTWLSFQWQEWLRTSIRIKGSKWGDITGFDQRINPNMVPTANVNLQSGERVDVFVGIDLTGQTNIFKDHRLALEVGYPAYQYLDGPQLGAGLQLTLGWQKSW